MNFNTLNRITIIGNGGSGKSVLAVQISKILKLPVIHLDQYYWVQNKAIHPTLWKTIHHSFVTQSHWIIEGTQMREMEERFNHSTTIIFLDISMLLCLFRILIKNFSHKKAYFYPHNLLKNIKWILGFNKNKKKIIEAIKKLGVDSIVLKSKKQINNYLNYLSLNNEVSHPKR